jgi:uncharacterized OsmC-like protein
MMMYAKSNGIDLARVDFTVSKEMHPAPRRIGKLTTTYRLATRCSEDDLARLVRAGKTCPVRLSLGPDVEVIESYERISP